MTALYTLLTEIYFRHNITVTQFGVCNNNNNIGSIFGGSNCSQSLWTDLSDVS